MKKFSKVFFVLAAALVVQLPVSNVVNATTIKENDINSEVSAQDSKENKNSDIQSSKDISKKPWEKSKKSKDDKEKSSKDKNNKNKDCKDDKHHKGPGSWDGLKRHEDDENLDTKNSKESNAPKVPDKDNKVQKPEDNKVKDLEDSKDDKTQKPQDEKESNIPKLMKVNQISPNQIEISYDRDIDVELGTKAINYWIQDTMNDKPKGIASFGKNDKVDARNSLTDSKVRIEAKEDSQRTFVLTFSKDIPKGAEYKLIISNVTIEGAPSYSGENGIMTFVGK